MTAQRTNMMLTRRSVLLTGAAGMAALATGCNESPPDSWPPYDNALVIDGLGGFSDPNAQGAQSMADRVTPRALADLRRSGVAAQNITLPYVAGPSDPYQTSIDAIDEMDALIAAHPDHLLKALSVADIRHAKESGRSGVIYGFQNSEQLGGDAGRVAEFFERGIRVMQLTYNIANSLGHGSMVEANEGLTPFGFEAVEAMNAAGMVIDLSHSGERTCLTAIEHSSAPIWLSHTGCRALADMPRNKTDEEMRNCVEKGGVVGIYFMPFLREDGQALAADAVAHMEHAINVCGEDHVAFGSDGSTSTMDDLEAYREIIREQIARRRAMGIGATGENDDVVPFLPDMRGPDVYRDFAWHLSRRGHSDARIEKIMGGNLIRYFGEIWPS